jgi:hypothetical protein
MARTADNAGSVRPVDRTVTAASSDVETVDLRLLDDVDVADLDADGGLGTGRCQPAVDTVVVHVQLRPRLSATRRCLAALSALASQHPGVSFALTGLSKDARVVRVTVGVELGPRDQIAKFSAEAQAAYAFVDGLFTQLYDHMPVYVAEPAESERGAAAGVLAAFAAPSPRVPQPRIPAPRQPVDVADLVGAPATAVPTATGVPVPRRGEPVPA